MKQHVNKTQKQTNKQTHKHGFAQRSWCQMHFVHLEYIFKVKFLRQPDSGEHPNVPQGPQPVTSPKGNSFDMGPRDVKRKRNTRDIWKGRFFLHKIVTKRGTPKNRWLSFGVPLPTPVDPSRPFSMWLSKGGPQAYAKGKHGNYNKTRGPPKRDHIHLYRSMESLDTLDSMLIFEAELEELLAKWKHETTKKTGPNQTKVTSIPGSMKLPWNHRGSPQKEVTWLWLKEPVPKWNPGKWKHGPKPAQPEILQFGATATSLTPGAKKWVLIALLAAWRGLCAAVIRLTHLRMERAVLYGGAQSSTCLSNKTTETKIWNKRRETKIWESPLELWGEYLSQHKPMPRPRRGLTKRVLWMVAKSSQAPPEKLGFLMIPL